MMMSDEQKANVDPEKKEQPVEKKDAEKKASPFITEEDVFEIVVKYYKVDGKIMVADIDVDYDSTKDQSEVKMVIKYPDQGDCDYVKGTLNLGEDDGINLRDVARMELVRLMRLMRKWNLDCDLIEENILRLEPKIAKSLTNKIAGRLGYTGVL